MPKLTVCVMSVVLVALLSPVAMGALEFINPPETYASSDEWELPFPYQRNVMIDFGTNPGAPPPLAWPSDPANGSAYDLLPGVNYQMAGTEDPALYDSDWLQITGAYTWYAQDPLFGTGRDGILLFNNLAGSGTLEATITWHLDNLDDNSLRKDIWSELIWGQTGTGTSLDISLAAQPGHWVQDMHIAVPPSSLGNNWLVADGYGQIRRNPEWEEATLSLHIAQGEALAIDSWHTATECVPEPGTCAFMGAGLLALLIRRRRRDA
jgi:hypothetical protein